MEPPSWLMQVLQCLTCAVSDTLLGRVRAEGKAYVVIPVRVLLKLVHQWVTSCVRAHVEALQIEQLRIDKACQEVDQNPSTSLSTKAPQSCGSASSTP